MKKKYGTPATAQVLRKGIASANDERLFSKRGNSSWVPNNWKLFSDSCPGSGHCLETYPKLLIDFLLFWLHGNFACLSRVKFFLKEWSEKRTQGKKLFSPHSLHALSLYWATKVSCKICEKMYGKDQDQTLKWAQKRINSKVKLSKIIIEYLFQKLSKIHY